MIEFKFSQEDVDAMVDCAEKSGKRLGSAARKELWLMTNLLVASPDANRKTRERIAARDAAEAAIRALRSSHLHLAECGVDVTTIEAAFASYLGQFPTLIDPMTGTRAEVDHSCDDLPEGEIGRLCESLALACRTAFAPRDGHKAPSLRSESTATRYAAEVFKRLTGKPHSAGAVKAAHLRLEKWRAKRRQIGTKD